MVGHIAVVSNPSAGKGRGRASAEVALARLRDLHGDVRAYEGASAAESRTLVAAALAARPDALVIDWIAQGRASTPPPAMAA